MTEPKMIDYGNVYEAILADNRQMRQRIAELTAENERLAQENNMLFDRAAQRLAMIKELQAAYVELEGESAPEPMVPHPPQAMDEDAFNEMIHKAATEPVHIPIKTQSEWQPLPEGRYTRLNWDGNGEVTLAVYHKGQEIEQWHSSNTSHIDEISLPDDIRLCRRTASTPQQPTMPTPDWANAPEWAMWWARDCNGKAHWFENEPSWIELDGEWGLPVKWNVMVDDSLDGRTTLRQRSVGSGEATDEPT